MIGDIFKVEINKKDLSLLARTIGHFNDKAFKWAIEREAYRLHRQLRQYAMRWGNKTWGPFAPITRVLRKGRGLGPWMGRYLRYHVQKAPLGYEAHIGVLSRKDKTLKGPKKFEPLSAQFAASYLRMARGYKFYQSRRRQRHQFAVVKSKGKIPFSGQMPFSPTKALAKRHFVLVPKVGWHIVKARPFIEPVMRQERDRSIRNIRRLYSDRLAGVNNKGWIDKWGNK